MSMNNFSRLSVNYVRHNSPSKTTSQSHWASEHIISFLKVLSEKHVNHWNHTHKKAEGNYKHVEVNKTVGGILAPPGNKTVNLKLLLCPSVESWFG